MLNRSSRKRQLDFFMKNSSHTLKGDGFVNEEGNRKASDDTVRDGAAQTAIAQAS
jgi:hypothetical protein